MRTRESAKISCTVLGPVARILFVSAMACGQIACGSSNKTDTNGTTTGGTTTGGTTTGGTTGTACSTPNCDATGSEPKFSAESNAVVATPAGATTTISIPYIRFQNSNSPTTQSEKFEIAGLDYDPCVFDWNHAQIADGNFNYSVFPTAPFNFFGVYLVNVTPGAALSEGTYTSSSTTGQYLYIAGGAGDANNPSGSGYNVTSCTTSDYEAVSGGNVTIKVDSSGNVTSGTFDLITTNDSSAVGGGTIKGDFTVGSCGTASGTEPVASQPDANACTLK